MERQELTDLVEPMAHAIQGAIDSITIAHMDLPLAERCWVAVAGLDTVRGRIVKHLEQPKE